MADIERDIVLRVKSETEQAQGQFKNLKQELRSIENQLNQMAEAGETGTAAFQNLQRRAGEVKDQLGDTKAAIKALSSDTFKLDAFTQAAQGIAGGFAAAQGAMSLFGSENQAVEEAIKKTQGAMALLQGVTAITNILQKETAFSALFLAESQTANAVATEGASVATKGFSKALIATGIGAIVVAIGTLIAYWDDLKGAVESTSVSTKIASDTFEGIGAKFAESQVKVNGLIKDFENYNTTTARRKEILKELEKISPNYFNKELKNINDLKKAQESFNKALLQQAIIEASRKKITELTSENIEKMAEAQNKANMTLDEFLQQSGFKNAYDNAKKNGGDLKRFLDSYSTYIAEKKKEVADLDKELQKQIAPFLKVSQQAEDQLKKLGGEAIPEPTTKEKPKTEKPLEDKQKELEKMREYEAEYEEHLKKEREKNAAQNAKDFTDRTQKEYEYAIKLSNEYYDHLINEAKLNGQDTTQLEIQKLQNQLQIQKDYAKSTIAIEDQIALKKKEITDKENERKVKEFEKVMSDDTVSLTERLRLNKEFYDKKLIDEKTYKGNAEKLEKELFQKRKATAMEWAQVTKDGLDALSALNEAFSSKDKEGQRKAFERDKKFKIASAVTATAMGVAQQLAVPQDQITGLNFAKAAIVLATGIAQIKKISDTKFEGGGSAPSNNIGANVPTQPSQNSQNTPGINSTMLNLDAQGNLRQGPARTYVVESEISDKQRRSRQLSQTAILGK